jgi:hypothetical protein
MHFNPVVSANGAWVGLSLLTLVLVFQYIYLPTLVDGFRDRLFSIRRELLLLVAQERLPVTDPAYVALRKTINGFIRYAERVTFLRGVFIPALVMSISSRRERLFAARQTTLDHTLTKTSDPDVREKLREIEYRAAKATSLHVLASSPVAWVVAVVLVLPILVLVALLAGSVSAAKASHRKLVKRVSDRAACEVELLCVA